MKPVVHFILSVVGWTAVVALLWMWMLNGNLVQPGNDAANTSILFTVMLGPLFGIAYFFMSWMPKTVKDPVGWRRWRPVMWWFGMAAYFATGVTFSHNFEGWLDMFGASLILSGMITIVGCALGWSRAEQIRLAAWREERDKLRQRLQAVEDDAIKAMAFPLE